MIKTAQDKGTPLSGAVPVPPSPWRLDDFMPMPDVDWTFGVRHYAALPED
jgi:hypothetical protein